MQAVSRLYGRRIRGDIGPIGIDPRTRQPGAILAPAVSLTGAEQYYDEESAVQNFTLGSRMQVDERTYHYARAALAIVDTINPGTLYLAVMTDQILAVNDLLSAAPARVVGDVTVVVTNGGAGFQAGTVVADELVGGYVEIWSGGNQMMWRRIIANTGQVAGVPGTITITVDRPFNHNVAVLSQVTVHPSIYRATMSFVDAGLADHCVAVGLPPIPVPINHYYWLQTWGPCFVGPTGLGVWPLAAAAAGQFIDVYFSMNEGGSKSSLLANPLAGGPIATTESPQRIGYALGAGNYGSGEIMLQLAP